tara:strand:+ start:3200 stop:3445 length:246 start_codon:yes stop_codon:yes gene_type:complete
MSHKNIKVKWPNGKTEYINTGSNWLLECNKAGIDVPIGCLTGRCGACEIEVNGKVIRSCIAEIQDTGEEPQEVKIYEDIYW